MDSGNAVVAEEGDQWRDTFVATLRGDGHKLPGKFILQQTHNAARASERFVPKSVTPCKGMNIEKMIEYIDEIAVHVRTFSLLIMDKASSHTSSVVLNHIRSKTLPDGTQMFEPVLLPAKTSFLISPCDKSFFALFKHHFQWRPKLSIIHKKNSALAAYQQVSAEAVRSFFRGCGLVTTETMETIRIRLREEVSGHFTRKQRKALRFYRKWIRGRRDVEGSPEVRYRRLAGRIGPNDSALDGDHWNT